MTFCNFESNENVPLPLYWNLIVFSYDFTKFRMHQFYTWNENNGIPGFFPKVEILVFQKASKQNKVYISTCFI